MSSLESLFGGKLTNRKKQSISTSSINTPYVGIYFSGHWCPPCRKFTPELAKYYNEGLNKKLEIVFVSSDKDQHSFDEYLGEMPWLALPYSDRSRKEKLSDKYNVDGIPTLIILDKDGNFISNDGTTHVTIDPKGDDLDILSEV